MSFSIYLIAGHVGKTKKYMYIFALKLTILKTTGGKCSEQSNPAPRNHQRNNTLPITVKNKL